MEKGTQKTGTAEKKAYSKISYALKQELVTKILNGQSSKRSLCLQNNISRSTLDYWCSKLATQADKQAGMSLKKENKKLKEKVEELEFIKEFQQDIMIEMERMYGKVDLKKYLPEHLYREIEEKRKRASK